MPYADLHLHSTCSDGSDSPTRVVERAAALGITAIALTDHDTVAGVEEAQAAAAYHRIQFLPGVEISTRFNDREVHVVALGVDIHNTSLLDLLQRQQHARHTRAQLILDKLRGLGMHINIDPTEMSEGIGRLNIARALQQAGIVHTAQQAFDRYLGTGRPAYEPKQVVPILDAITTTHASHGLAFIAHPGLSKSLRRALPSLLTLPFDGIEAWHISHSPAQTQQYLALARDRNLLISGGSDCHGKMKGREEMGKVRVPLNVFQLIQNALKDGSEK